jgi:hypothetical protein
MKLSFGKQKFDKRDFIVTHTFILVKKGKMFLL